jgi:hypothetical protein
MLIKIKDANSQELHITFDYAAETVKKIKSIKGLRWHLESKCWILSDIALEMLRQYFKECGPKRGLFLGAIRQAYSGTQHSKDICKSPEGRRASKRNCRSILLDIHLLHVSWKDKMI